MQPNVRSGEDFQHILDKQVKEMQEKAAALKDAFAAAATTVSSRDGSVTVTVEPNGALSNLQLGHRACELGSARLTTTIMETVREAQRQTARRVSDSFTLINGDGETAELVRSFLPVEEPTEEEAAQEKFAADMAPEPEPTPPAAPPASPRPTPRRRRPTTSDGEDEMRPW